MAKKTINESILEKIFYYIGKGMRPVILKKMSAKSPTFKKKYNNLVFKLSHTHINNIWH